MKKVQAGPDRRPGRKLRHGGGERQDGASLYLADLEPTGVGLAPRGSIYIEGHNPIHLTIDPGCNPQLGAAGMLANCIPRVVEAKPGFITVADLAIPHTRPTRKEGWF